MNILNDINRKAEVNEQDSAKVRSCEITIGVFCPRCRQTRMEYDGLLNLRCKACGYIIGGSYT